MANVNTLENLQKNLDTKEAAKKGTLSVEEKNLLRKIDTNADIKVALEKKRINLSDNDGKFGAKFTVEQIIKGIASMNYEKGDSRLQVMGGNIEFDRKCADGVTRHFTIGKNSDAAAWIQTYLWNKWHKEIGTVNQDGKTPLIDGNIWTNSLHAISEYVGVRRDTETSNKVAELLAQIRALSTIDLGEFVPVSAETLQAQIRSADIKKLFHAYTEQRKGITLEKRAAAQEAYLAMQSGRYGKILNDKWNLITKISNVNLLMWRSYGHPNKDVFWAHAELTKRDDKLIPLTDITKDNHLDGVKFAEKLIKIFTDLEESDRGNDRKLLEKIYTEKRNAITTLDEKRWHELSTNNDKLVRLRDYAATSNAYKGKDTEKTAYLDKMDKLIKSWKEKVQFLFYKWKLIVDIVNLEKSTKKTNLTQEQSHKLEKSYAARYKECVTDKTASNKFARFNDASFVNLTKRLTDIKNAYM